MSKIDELKEKKGAARKAWLEALAIRDKTTKAKAEDKAYEAWNKYLRICDKTPEGVAANKAWEALIAAREKQERHKMSKIDELKEKKKAAREAWLEALDILSKTPEGVAADKARDAWREALAIRDKTTEAKAEAKAWKALIAAKAKLREERK